ncbi:CHAT domain-containing protein [Plectonema cf. radiosum LEGE 06105]|uniref:CHAT domain-containing protein n=1 Tax=Plectonema cf. radiosum LEGE 06105 TaxID=945769 RepID=A0A8J7FCZ0_9CYAN|nr:CHAT domain-containing protein [Plectonema radiosum]MBE9215544.1 CHAT domain-containing protein [Plectonema cf. radiosum LEGE 06105]
MKPIKRNWKPIRFWLTLVLTALLCITSPSFIQIPMSRATAQKTTPSVEEQARTKYQQGEFSDAAKLFQQASLAYQAAKDPIRQALSLSNLSLSYQQLARWDDADRAITDSITLLTSIKETNSQKLSALAQSFDIQGGLQLARGQVDAALKSWQQATIFYTQLNKPQLVLTSLTNQAQALQNLGLYRRSIPLLYTALKLPEDATTNPELKVLLSKTNTDPETATALRTLGDSLRVMGNLPQADLVLQQSLIIANKLNLPDMITEAQLSLGNTASDATDSPAALKFYQQAATSNSVDLRTQAQVNQLSLLVDTKQMDAAKSLLSQIQTQIGTLPPSYAAIEARVNLAQTMLKMRKTTPEAIPLPEIAQLLSVTVQEAAQLGNPRIQADALGSLGNVYELTGQWGEAEKLTQQAVQLAQQINAGDVAYRWQWQLGRVTKAQGKTDSAIAAYSEAVGTIKSLRADLAAASPNVQFSFRDAVEPIHRELVELLVKSNQKDNLKTARNVIEGLQLVELDNFFREACLTAKPEQIDLVDRLAAVIYPIILEDQLAIIVSLPKPGQTQTKDNRDFRYYKTNINKKQVESLASRLQNNLSQSTAFDLTLPELQKMYDLVIRPEAAELAASKVETLVFVLDGVLRNIPMGVLHDGKNFLIEKYSIALTPGLQLLAPRSLKKERLGALVAGISEAQPPFSALPNVEKEVQKIESELPTQVLFNQEFTNSAFENKVSAVSYPIVHLATHGQFSSQEDQTFIMTWNGKIKVNELSSLLKTVELSRNNPLELLILSACETAAGDDKSALGLAGVAVRSGARSTIATLWQINDEASATLMSQFYDQLIQANKTGISKAEALRRAQIAILNNPEYKSPYYWGAYVLLGNWT